jgi:hypothetical protein
VRWLACISKLKTYADGSLAADRAIQAGQILSEMPDKKGYSGLLRWGLGLMISSPKNSQAENL